MSHSLPDRSTLAMILGHAPGYVMLVGTDLRIRYINRVTHGFTLDQIVGCSYYDLVTPDQGRKISAAFTKLRETGEEQNFESDLEPPDGTRMWFLTRMSPVYDEAGEFDGFVAITTDITERKVAEERLAQARQDLVDSLGRAGIAEIATGVLHNVGNLLNSVNVAARAIEERLESPTMDLLDKSISLMGEQGDGLVGFIADDPRGQKLPGLLAQILQELQAERTQMRAEVARLTERTSLMRTTIESQQASAKPGGAYEEVEPSALLRKALNLFNVDVELGEIDANLEVRDTSVIVIDRNRTMQILVNLLRNAIEALEGSGAPRTIALRQWSDDERHYFEIEDNGRGIVEANLGRIFEPGFTTKARDSGFGLHASASTARAMNGAIEVHSGGEGKGARFQLWLPRRSTRSGPAQP